MNPRFLFLPLVIFFLPGWSTAQVQSVAIAEGWSSQLVEPSLTALPEKGGQTYDEAEVTSGRYDHLFVPFSQDLVSGTSTSNWLRLRVENTTGQAQKLFLGTSRFEHLDFWLRTDSTISARQRSGQSLATNEKSVQIPGLSFFTFELQPGQKAGVYLKAVNKNASNKPQIVVPLTLMNEEEYRRSYERPTNYTYMFIGAVAIMAVFNFMVFFITGLRAYLYYTGYVIAVTSFILAITPQFAMQIYGHMDVTRPFVCTSGQVSLIMYTLVARELVESKKYFPRADRIVKFILAALGVAIALAFFEPAIVLVTVINFTSALTLYPVLLTAAVVMTMRGHSPSRYFLIASAIYMTCNVTMILQLLYVVPPVLFGLTSSTLVQIGVSVELALFSIGLGARINEMRKRVAQEELEKERILREQEEERKHVLEQQNLILEEKVKQRTAQIEEQKAVLEKSLADLKLAQSKLVESEKMASLGQLTAGIAHEINNPINFVSVGVKNLVRNFEEAKEVFENYLNPKLGPDEAARHLADTKRRKQVFELFDDAEMLFKSIQNGVDRTISIVKSLRNFSRLDEGQLKYVDLHEGLDSTLEILQSQIKKKAEVVKNYGQLPPVECAAGKINQVFLNIINNALQAIEGHGAITLETKYLKEKNEVAVAISDTGKGMSEEVKRRLFEPFFTTKPIGEGTGLGLSISYGIIEEHKGRIEVESPARPSHADGELGKGSTFVIYLPVQQP